MEITEMQLTGWLGETAVDPEAPPPVVQSTPSDRGPAPSIAAHGDRGFAIGLALVGLTLWAVAQALPAYTEPSIFINEPDIVTPGLKATLFAWLLGLMDPNDGTWLIIVAWSANVWFLSALVALHRRSMAALGLAGAAVACSAVGMWILLRGGFPENPFAVIAEVGIGSYLWFAAMCVTLLGAIAGAIPGGASRSGA